MKKYAGLIILLIMAPFIGLGNETKLNGDINKGCYGAIHRPFLDFFHSFQHQYDAVDVKATIDLLDVLRADAWKYEYLGLVGEYEEAYELSWVIAIKVWQRVGDVQMKHSIMNRWNEVIKEGEYFHVQINALSDTWEEAFVNDCFWNYIGQSRSKRVVESFRFMVLVNGDEGDYKRFMESRKSNENYTHSDQIKDFDKWLAFRKKKMENPEADLPMPETGYIGFYLRATPKRGELARFEELGRKGKGSVPRKGTVP